MEGGKAMRNYGIKRVGPNRNGGRDLVVGDIHGYYSKLAGALIAHDFDMARDRLFSVGDLVDRGPESELALNWLAQPWFFAVRGNHDDMAMRWPEGRMQMGTYMGNGGGWNIAATPDQQRLVADAMEMLPIAIELETSRGIVGIVHADVPGSDWPTFRRALMDENLPASYRSNVADLAMWSRDRFDNNVETPVAGVLAVVAGHSPFLCEPGEVKRLGNVVYIDTYAWRHGHFTLLDAETLEAVQP